MNDERTPQERKMNEEIKDTTREATLIKELRGVEKINGNDWMLAKEAADLIEELTKPKEEYRFLEEGEMLKDGDQWKWKTEHRDLWHDTMSQGCRVGETGTHQTAFYRRKLTQENQTREDGTPLNIPALPVVEGYRFEYRGTGWEAEDVSYIVYNMNYSKWLRLGVSLNRTSNTGGAASGHYAEVFKLKKATKQEDLPHWSKLLVRNIVGQEFSIKSCYDGRYGIFESCESSDFPKLRKVHTHYASTDDLVWHEFIKEDEV